MNRRCAALLLAAACVSATTTLTGCINKPQNAATTRPVTDVDPRTAEASYWLAQPATTEVTHASFQTLWDTCERVAKDHLFAISRRDFRGGLLTTEPMISKQWFEVWRKDSVRVSDVEENSLGGVRRSIHFQFTQNPDGSYTVAPKVVVERHSTVDAKYRTDEAEEDYVSNYWYATRRDPAYEVELGQAIRGRLGKL
jgi:hypothetical protein